MFDGIPSPRRRITTREGKTLLRVEDAVYRAECEVWKAEQKVLRAVRKKERYAEKVSRRLGKRGMTCGDLIIEWIVEEMRVDMPPETALPGPG